VAFLPMTKYYWLTGRLEYGANLSLAAVSHSKYLLAVFHWCMKRWRYGCLKPHGSRLEVYDNDFGGEIHPIYYHSCGA
jgi:hypothetical protein